MAQGVEDKIGREDGAALAFDLGGASMTVKVVDGRSKVRMAFPVGKYELACPGLGPSTQHGSRPVCKRDNPSGVLALAVPHAEESESSAVDGRKSNVCPFQMQSLPDPQTTFEHQDGDVLQWLRASRSEE